MDKHKFTFSEFRPEHRPNQQPYVRLLMFFHKRPDISQEKFQEWWRTVHADLTMAAQGLNAHVLRYVQTHTTPEQKKQLKSLGMEPLSYDAMSEIHLRSLDDWIKFSNSPVFAEKLYEDGKNFMQEPLRVMLGQDNIVYGSKIDTSGGTDGIMPHDSRLKLGSKL
ncbi:hypothetical protein CC78DRAFT_598644 [Lojkania enalia]|uniref:EthD domain-containing protein n=1 Tax=Lojkania enalia TaxID=147567 RepID=A0A9P4N119_9PLEO|nr:hypothetical protein CC78DRAFT_598644 [Didymosphaeria enalia]